MSGIEILFRKIQLIKYIQQMNSLKTGTSYLARGGNLFSRSKSETAEALEETYRTLQEIERSFLVLVEHTSAALDNAAEAFESADNQAGSIISDATSASYK